MVREGGAGNGFALCCVQVLPLYRETLSLIPEGLGQGESSACQLTPAVVRVVHVSLDVDSSARCAYT